jgi:hypothetical protein
LTNLNCFSHFTHFLHVFLDWIISNLGYFFHTNLLLILNCLDNICNTAHSILKLEHRSFLSFKVLSFIILTFFNDQV